MLEYLSNNWAVGIPAAIIIAVIANALWDMVTKPTIIQIGNGAFSLLTFGAKKASDRVYRQASQSNIQLISLEILSILIAIMISLVTVVFLETFIPAVFKEDEIRYIFRGAASKSYLFLFLFFVIVFVIYAFYRWSFNLKVNLIVTQFNHIMKICAPFLTSEEILIFNQEFALMNNKSDFDAIIFKLSECASAHNISLPGFYRLPPLEKSAT